MAASSLSTHHAISDVSVTWCLDYCPSRIPLATDFQGVIEMDWSNITHITFLVWWCSSQKGLGSIASTEDDLSHVFAKDMAHRGSWGHCGEGGARGSGMGSRASGAS